MLRVAVPNKGSLSEAATEILAEAGYRQRRTTKDLSLTDPDNGVEFYYLRPRDIAVYVGEGTLDVGISGRDLVLDSHADAETILELGFGGSTFRFAGRPGVARSVKDLEGKRIATSFAGILSDHLAENGVKASVVKLDGAVESAVQLGVADVIADVVETGTTLRQAGLEVFGEPILKSEAVLIKRHAASVEQPNGLEQLVRRLEGVLVARNYVMMDYDIRAEAVEAANAVAPGLESPTVSPLHREGWVAVRVMVPRAEAQRIMDLLWEIGARAILTTDIHACRI
ncbi:ATP phosphoribosyltransferase [Kribbella sp. VKM Ac-2568]|uniref:ATP phosphoribosyltransferase n=1 Tax=Kribbella sp. VKM Ac-2568 TaxID=2512219 RepID=UPI00104FB542|nr:ATP phosphoribosyltransferase [Kribbella sp. VKM Ac-2568]TCM41671.1 ATP phosphoribosyltransferase [Kribbella sp. VKM Ac-2568]